MKDKHVRVRIAQCLALAEASECPRRKLAALIVEPLRNVVVADGYNGANRGGGRLCGGETCERDRLAITSGEHLEVGCHHAESNAICNAAASGSPTLGAYLFVTGEPCPNCARLIGQAGIARVYCVRGGYLGAQSIGTGGDGLALLRAAGVEVVLVEGPPDPRSSRTSTPGSGADCPFYTTAPIGVGTCGGNDPVVCSTCSNLRPNAAVLDVPLEPLPDRGDSPCVRWVTSRDVSRRPADPDCRGETRHWEFCLSCGRRAAKPRPLGPRTEPS